MIYSRNESSDRALTKESRSSGSKIAITVNEVLIPFHGGSKRSSCSARTLCKTANVMRDTQIRSLVTVCIARRGEDIVTMGQKRMQEHVKGSALNSSAPNGGPGRPSQISPRAGGCNWPGPGARGPPRDPISGHRIEILAPATYGHAAIARSVSAQLPSRSPKEWIL